MFGFLTGVQTPNCIRATAFDAIAHDYPSVVVLSDATAAASDEVHAGTFCYYLEHSHLESDHHVLFLPLLVNMKCLAFGYATILSPIMH